MVAVLSAFTAIIAIASADKMHPRLSLRSLKEEIKYPEEQNTKFWVDKAQSILAGKLQNAELNKNRAKNIIMFLGDGMSVHTVTATRAFMGDSSKQISFEKFPYLGLSKTYCVNKQVADSACSATAYLSGVKGNYGTIGVNAQVKRSDCTKAQDPSTHTESIAEWAQDAGKSTGLVTTARVTHASPAGVYAHTANRNWESDTDIIKDKCSAVDNLDIARQLVHTPVGRNLKVIMGGGRREFRGKKQNDEEGIKGRRTDGRDLIQEWIADKKLQDADASYVWSRKGLNSLDLSKTEYLLGLFSSNHCPYHGDLAREGLEKSDPSLSEMTEAAIKVLKKNKKGYFLFVEGAKIDMAHHENWARKALEDTKEFAHAVELARNMTSEKDTLIVVTSDHSHTMTINGYPLRSQDILGFSDEKGTDDLPFTALSYANGPGYYNTFSKEEGRRDLSLDDLTDPKYSYMATVPLGSETHGGDDVAIFTSGPYAHTFTGNYEQSNIPALMAYAADIGPFQESKLSSLTDQQ
ncbi:membrane-bound alkaline phosphatase isoform X2 [Episyrphus balteatus]|uniref:membrane-bound alkaline phosphatase isoform X2 n=1 Tax=Episyrphus balteatus TaxID=286459 RepID=UPI0024850340|nr:membrane-bound alkaline phosphatase isoform X2 [Episyrphus balteatus]